MYCVPASFRRTRGHEPCFTPPAHRRAHALISLCRRRRWWCLHAPVVLEEPDRSDDRWDAEDKVKDDAKDQRDGREAVLGEYKGAVDGPQQPPYTPEGDHRADDADNEGRCAVDLVDSLFNSGGNDIHGSAFHRWLVFHWWLVRPQQRRCRLRRRQADASARRCVSRVLAGHGLMLAQRNRCGSKSKYPVAAGLPCPRSISAKPETFSLEVLSSITAVY